MSRIALILGLLALPVLLYLTAEFFTASLSAPADRAPTARVLLGVPWRGGEARVVDRSTHPGRYDSRVEWHGPSGERRELYAVGDHEPELLLENDHLVVRWFVTRSGAPGPREVRFEEPR